MKPNLTILPTAQQQLWPLLSSLPKQFILYGGTAIALQLGHRESVDFDFFSAQPLEKMNLINTLPFLKQSKLMQPEINTLNCFVATSNGSVKFQFLCGLGNRQGRVEKPLVCEDNHIYVASLRDLLATKLNTIQARAEIKDYFDIHTMLQHGLTLQDGLACAQAIFGTLFDPGTSLRALCSYHDGSLNELPQNIKDELIAATLTINEIPHVKPLSPTIDN